MKKFILSLLAVVMAAGAYAHDSAKVKKSPAEMANKRADKLKTELNLSDEQRSKVYTTIFDKINKHQAVKEKYKGTKDKKSMRAEMKTVHDDFDASMKSILTAEQYGKWQELKSKQKEKHKEKKGKGASSSNSQK
jgi:periplasmic protein CpxP/Spy